MGLLVGVLHAAFRVAYRAVYEYDDVVIVNNNDLRVFPRREDWQEPLRVSLETRPPGRHWFYRDRFGNTVARVVVREPHRSIEFRAVSEVRMPRPYRLRPEGGGPPVPLEPSLLTPEARLFLRPSPLVDPRRLAGAARLALGGGGRDLAGALEALTAWVYREIKYERGYTDVKTRAHEVLEIGRGVCQDKAHLLIGLLRAVGVPARYVSGALTTERGETHAWVEAYWPGSGWVPADPTHNRVYDLGFDYVKYAHGRDYSDVPPVNGYYVSRASGRIRLVEVVPERIA